MPKATEDQQQFFETIVAKAAYNMPYTDEAKNKITLLDVPEPPRPDEKGRVNGEGYTVTWSAIVDPSWGNFSNNMHGAAHAWIVDTCTSAVMVLLSNENFWGAPMVAGVSLNINVDYLHPAPVKIRIVCTVIRLTQTLANINCEIRDFETDKPLSVATHLKTWRPARQSKL